MTSTTTTTVDVEAPSQAPPPGRRHIAGLDGLRALAAILVVLYHYDHLAPLSLPEPFRTVVSTGWVGVDIFFVISGFILFLPWARASLDGSRVDVRRYARNRARRILPAYWFNLVVLVTVVSPVLLVTWDGWRTILLNATFTAGYVSPGSRVLINLVAWTLFIEVTFYVLLPVLAGAFVRRRWVLSLPVALGVTMLLRWAAALTYGSAPDQGHAQLRDATSTIFGTLDAFALGMTTAAVWVLLERRDVRLPRWLPPLLAVGGLVGMWWTVGLILAEGTDYWSGAGPTGWLPLITLRTVSAAFVSVALFGVCYQANPVRSLFSFRPLRYLGTVSFGIYLWHLPVAQWVRVAIPPELSVPQRAVVLLALGGAVTVVWAAVSFHVVERPFLRRRTPATRPDPDARTVGARARTGGAVRPFR